jgi:predicted aldo/keto reductase-like oxidoreductase
MLAALKWVINKSTISTTIPSMTDMDQLDENLKAMAHPFAPSDQKLLAAHLDKIQPALLPHVRRSAKATCQRACRSPTCCASSPTLTDTASSHWGGRDFWS